MATNLRVPQIHQPLTAWQSLPALIRFAAWVWAISTVACLALGWLVVVVVLGLR